MPCSPMLLVELRGTNICCYGHCRIRFSSALVCSGIGPFRPSQHRLTRSVVMVGLTMMARPCSGGPAADPAETSRRHSECVCMSVLAPTTLANCCGSAKDRIRMIVECRLMVKSTAIVNDSASCVCCVCCWCRKFPNLSSLYARQI